MKRIILPLLTVALAVSSIIGQVNITFKLNTANITSIAPSGIYVAGGEGMGVPGDHQLTDSDGDGIYTLTIQKDQGFSSYYTFLNGNCPDWNCKENISGLDCSNPENHNDRFLRPVMSDTTILACFGTCDANLGCTKITQSSNPDSEINTPEIMRDPSDDAPVTWVVDFFDDFDNFNSENWQDQRIWVNNETQCYVPDGAYGTREVSEGTLKLKVINIKEKRPCDNLDKHGKEHPATEYVAGRICSKNRKEFVKGKWTARLRLNGNGEASMFPAWWILGAQNNEPPVQEPDEYVAWPLTGSGEIDIFEHHGDHHKDHFTTGAIKSLGCADKGDWWSTRKGIDATLNEYHEYSVEWRGSDLVYRVDGKEVYRNVNLGDNYPEPMFAILNFAKITDSPMEGEWVMEVDWVKHEYGKLKE